MIRAMDADLIAQIKAGEVIERPASVVKELLENALDAEASRIRIEIQDGGTSLIRVVDDGLGIDPQDLPLAFVEHTSSKLQSANQLESIHTLGFRGEALYAISNVSEIEAVSGRKGTIEAASVMIDHGRLMIAEPAASGGGTRIAVRNLFARVPARRKHLKSVRAETAAVHQLVAQYALGHPETAITLMADVRTVLSTPGSGELSDAFGAVYGANLVSKATSIANEDYGQVSGLICRPEVSRPNRTGVTLFINGRPVRSPALTFAVEDAYSGLLMNGRHPVAVVRIQLPPDQVDANVHPAKVEVRLLSDRAAFSAVRRAVLDGLAKDPSVAEPHVAMFSDGVAPGYSWISRSTPATVCQGVDAPEPPRLPYPQGVTFESSSDSSPPGQTFAHALPSLKVFGQAAQTFIIAEGQGGLYMIDQHAAHERVLFDELNDRGGSALSQPLLQTARFDLSFEQWTALEARSEDLAELGFTVEPFGSHCCIVRSVPVIRSRPVNPEVLLEVLDGLTPAANNDVRKRGMIVVACKAAVKAGQSLSMEEMREIVALLERTANPRSCPHGRPTMLHLSTERLEREFGRR